MIVRPCATFASNSVDRPATYHALVRNNAISLVSALADAARNQRVDDGGVGERAGIAQV